MEQTSRMRTAYTLNLKQTCLFSMVQLAFISLLQSLKANFVYFISFIYIRILSVSSIKLSNILQVIPVNIKYHFQQLFNLFTKKVIPFTFDSLYIRKNPLIGFYRLFSGIYSCRCTYIYNYNSLINNPLTFRKENRYKLLTLHLPYKRIQIGR